MSALIAGAVAFTGIVLVLVCVVLAAQAWLAPSGTVTVTVNGRQRLLGRAGAKLAEALAGGNILLPNACGGRGTCGQCRVVVVSGAGAVAPVETALVGRADRARGVRLACQVSLREDLAVELPPELLDVRPRVCRVRSTRSVSTLMKEIVLELPPGEPLEFEAGAYVLVRCPPHRTAFAEFELPPDVRVEWERGGLLELAVESAEPTTRGYSLANPPSEPDVAMLVVRIATPPPGAGRGVPPGVVSSWLFARRPGDEVTIAGPYGDFRLRDGDAEAILVGGGAGMAPLRSIALDALAARGTRRRMSFWYGARNLRELFYAETFEQLAARHENFDWHVALSEPRPEDRWEGETGFIHRVLFEHYLRDHPAPEACEYYLCGPPLMIEATVAMLDDLGVDPESIHYDDFGAGAGGAR